MLLKVLTTHRVIKVLPLLFCRWVIEIPKKRSLSNKNLTRTEAERSRKNVFKIPRRPDIHAPFLKLQALDWRIYLV